jgi:tape measure domain-containing protein
MLKDATKRAIIKLELDDKATKDLKKVQREMVDMTKTFAIASAAVTALGGMLVKTAGDVEQLEITFRSLTGSLGNAKVLMNDIYTLARRSPFKIPELEETARMLLSFGLELGNIIPLMETMGDLASGLGKDSLARMATTLGQVQGRGKLAGQEFLRLSRLGLPIAAQLAEDLNLSVEEVSSNVSKLNISFEQVVSALESIRQKRFMGLMEEQSNTLLGLWVGIKNEITITARQIGMATQVLTVSKDVSTMILEAFEGIRKFAFVVVGAVAQVAKWFVSLYNTIRPLLPIIIAVSGALAVMMFSLTVIIPAVAKLVLAFKALGLGATVLTMKLTLLGGVIGFIIALLGYFYIKNVKINDIFGDMTTAMPKWGEAAGKAGEQAAAGAQRAAETMDNLRKQIEAEKKAYEEQLADIVRRTRERIAQTRKELEREQRDFEEQMDKRNQKYEEESKAIEEQTDDRVRELEGYYSQTEQLDDENKDKRLAEIRDAIEQEKAMGQQRLEALKNEHNEEVAKAQRAFEEKNESRRQQLEEDIAMLERHADDINAINIGAAKDEIEILKEKHQERLKELEEQLQKEKEKRDAANADMVRGFGGALDDMTGLLDMFPESFDWADVFELPTLEFLFMDLAATVTKGLTGLLYGFISLVTGAVDLYARYLAEVGEVFGSETLMSNAQKIRSWTTAVQDNAALNLQAQWANIEARLAENRASGGGASGMTWVGEHGPELVNLPRGSHVYNRDDSARMVQSGDIVINVNAPVTGVDNLKEVIIQAVNTATERQNRLAKYNLV